ncbi:MAG: AAA family ATPase [Streptosporangiales bacterium]|nr:AAA family ATPase [Streptosporangiales bacterium]
MAGGTGRGGGQGLAAISAPGLVGRDGELAALVEALSGQPALVLVAGEAGIGKSRLLREFLARNDGHRRRTLLVGCPPFREPYTLGPVVDAVRQATDDVADLGLSGLAGALRPVFPEWADGLPPAPEPLDDAKASRHRLFRALAELLSRLDVGTLVLEDLHWADEVTQEFLLFLASYDPQQLSLVVSYRPEDVPADSLLLRLSSRLRGRTPQLRLDLEPLDVDQTAGLVSSMLGGEHVSAAFATFLHGHTDGLPLAVEESVRLMRDRADLVRRDGEWVRRRLDEIEVPPTVRDAVLERTYRLGADAQVVLRAAAVLSDPTDEAVVIATSGLERDRATAGLTDALACGLLVEDERLLVSFRHMLAGRSVYDAVPTPQRRALHARAGRALEGRTPPPIARLARHFREAGDTETWCGYGERAADLALASGDEATATDLLCDMIGAGDLSPRALIRLFDKVSMGALAHPSSLHDIVRVLRAALAAGDHSREIEGELRFQLGRALSGLEEYTACGDEFVLAVPLLTHAPLKAVRAMLLLGRPRRTAEAVAGHRRWLERAAKSSVRLSATDRLGVQVERVTSLLLLGEEDGWAEAAKIPEEPASPDERQHVVRAHLNIGDAAVQWGRYPEARRRLQLTVEMAERYELVRNRWLARVNLVHLDWFTGNWQGLAERAADRELDGVDLPMLREAVLVRGLLLAVAGERVAAAEHLEQILADTGRTGAVDASLEPAAALAHVHLADGRVDEALAVTADAVTAMRTKGLWFLATEIVPARVQTLLAAGRVADAGELVDAFTAGLGGRGAPSAGAALELCRALLTEATGDASDAAVAYGRAAEAWQALPRPYDALLARERQARCLFASGDDDAALALLTGALAGLTELGAVADATRVTHALRQHGVDVKRPWRGGRRGYGDELSPRELDVARLVIGGRTNREIGAELYLSPKTVARHLHGAMRKLGVSTRTALAVSVVEAGLASDTGRPTAERAG